MELWHYKRNTYKRVSNVNKITLAILPHAAWLIVNAYTFPHKILLISSGNQGNYVLLVFAADVML
jgi:hypothetical protein